MPLGLRRGGKDEEKQLVMFLPRCQNSLGEVKLVTLLDFQSMKKFLVTERVDLT